MTTIDSVTQVKEAVERARREMARVDQSVRDMAELCAGNLERCSVDTTTLTRMKRELANFNIHTGRWKK